MRFFTIWLLKAWPFLLFIPICFVHYLLLQLLCLFSWLPCPNNVEINKLMGLLFQISGGLLILYSIDSNLGHFKNNGLFKIFKDWFKTCPILKRGTQTITASCVISNSSGSSATIRSYKAPETIDEKIAHLQQQIDWAEEDRQEENIKIYQRISDVSSKFDKHHQQTNSNLNDLNLKFESVTVGGLKWQVFGFNLLFYSAILSYVG